MIPPRMTWDQWADATLAIHSQVNPKAGAHVDMIVKDLVNAGRRVFDERDRERATRREKRGRI